MRNFKILLVGLLLVFPGLAVADASNVPGAATWYFHVDLEQMRSEGAGKGLYDWMVDEVFAELKEDTGVDIEKELDRLTAYSLAGQGPVFLFEGNISQESKDRLMTIIAMEGDLEPSKSSGKSYYRLSGSDEHDRDLDFDGGNIEIQLEALEDESWISMALANKVLVTSSEEQMQALLKNGGNIAGKRSHNGALIVLTAEKALLQAGMDSAALGGDDDSGWDSNILRHTEQVAFLVAAAADKLAIEARLVTTEPDMAESLASVVRGLVSLVAFSDDLDDEVIAVLRGIKIKTDGRSLSISLAIDPDVIVAALSD